MHIFKPLKYATSSCYGKSCIFLMWQMMQNSPSVKKLHIFDTLWNAFFVRIRNFAYFCFLSRFFSFEKVRGGRLYYTRFSPVVFRKKVAPYREYKKKQTGKLLLLSAFSFSIYCFRRTMYGIFSEKALCFGFSSDILIIPYYGTEDFSQK